MDKFKLKNILNWLPKSTFKAGEGIEQGKFPFFTSSQFQSKWSDEALYEGECLIFGTGGNPSIHYFNGKFATSTDCIVTQIRSHNDKINIKYVYYFLKANSGILEKGFKGAAIKHISKSYLENIEVHIPNFEEQNRIVTILDKIDKIIDIRKKTIQILDNILLSYYHSQFGSKNIGYKTWKTIELQDYRKEIKGSMRTGPFGSSLTHDKFMEQGEVAVLGIDNVVDNVFRWGKKRFISNEDYQKLKSNRVFGRDVLISIMGTVGRSAVVPEDIGVAINTKHLVAITLDENRCNPYYLSYTFHSNPYVAQQLLARSRGAIMEGLNLSIIKQIKIKDAPVDLQNKFEIKYKAIQVIKNKMLDSSFLIENFLKSLFIQHLSPRKLIDVEIQLETLLNAINLNLPNEENDIIEIVQDLAYRQTLLEKLATQNFSDIMQYDKAKYVAFRLLKEYPEKVNHEYDHIKKKLIMS
ncbi:restriction endonuclease subunit S [Chryseobacterium sp. 22532]|uniref:restriction endonuclease subunit S n=1 Tax=Chryseobacterium sp. 22532 TaxID=3453938 RepID=UPI003F8297FB